MKIVLFCAGMFLAASRALSQDYYVDSEKGSDANFGTLIAPFKTIQKAAGIMLAGSTCYIRGGVYRETVIPANSGTSPQPITFTSYNSENVIISAANLVSGWQLYRGSIYQALIGWDLGQGFNQVFVNGEMVEQARWPNPGSNRLTNPGWQFGSANGTSVTFPVARAANYWTGGIVYGTFGPRWTAQGATITSSDPNGAKISPEGDWGETFTGSSARWIRACGAYAG